MGLFKNLIIITSSYTGLSLYVIGIANLRIINKSLRFTLSPPKTHSVSLFIQGTDIFSRSDRKKN